MIDLHSHILPAMDDGACCLEESLALVELLHAQGIKTVVATPHFYADRETVDSFLNRRERCTMLLKQNCTGSIPDMLLGAEVRYYCGISRLEGLHRLCIQNSSLLLLEMPTARWSEHTVRELEALSSHAGLRIVLAHMERYQRLQSTQTVERLWRCGILIQANADTFLKASTKRRALSCLRDGHIHFIGSDCHDLTSRPPRIGNAYAWIEKKLGAKFLSDLNTRAYAYIQSR